MQADYFKYLKKRSTASLLLRRLFLKPVANHFSGIVLDVGSGIGEFMELYNNSIGIDIHRDSVAFCNSKGLKCINADVYRLPFSDNFFDGVLMNNILEHLENPEDAFAEIKRVLKNNGKLIIELPGKKGFYFDRTHVKYWKKKEIVDFLEKRGFHSIRTRYFPLPLEIAGDILTHNKLRVSAINKKGKNPAQ
jgi:ubiquinone/menaquinone biosynthesis C-methylase UbiE